MYTLENKQVNQLYWSPLKLHVLTGLGNINGQIEFWDVGPNIMSAQEHFMLTHLVGPVGHVVYAVMPPDV